MLTEDINEYTADVCAQDFNRPPPMNPEFLERQRRALSFSSDNGDGDSVDFPDILPRSEDKDSETNNEQDGIRESTSERRASAPPTTIGIWSPDMSRANIDEASLYSASSTPSTASIPSMSTWEQTAYVAYKSLKYARKAPIKVTRGAIAFNEKHELTTKATTVVKKAGKEVKKAISVVTNKKKEPEEASKMSPQMY